VGRAGRGGGVGRGRPVGRGRNGRGGRGRRRLGKIGGDVRVPRRRARCATRRHRGSARRLPPARPRPEGSPGGAPRRRDGDPRARLRTGPGERFAAARAGARVDAGPRDHGGVARQRGRPRQGQADAGPAAVEESQPRTDRDAAFQPAREIPGQGGRARGHAIHRRALPSHAGSALRHRRGGARRRQARGREPRSRCRAGDQSVVGPGRHPQGAGAAQVRAGRRDRLLRALRAGQPGLAGSAHAARARASPRSASWARRASSSAPPRSFPAATRRPRMRSACCRCSSRTTSSRRSPSRAR
jgi:hypothetical protein